MAQALPIGQKSNKQYGISFNLPDIPAWVPEDAKAVINELILDTFRLGLQVVAGYVSDEAPRDTGALAESFGQYPANSTGGIELLGTDAVLGLTGRVYSSLPHAIVMDEGRRPGFPVSRVGIDAIGLWAQRKLGLSFDEAERAKYAIAISIQRRGIQGTNYFDRGMKRATPEVEAMLKAVGDEIRIALTTATGKRRVKNAGKFVGRVKGAKR